MPMPLISGLLLASLSMAAPGEAPKAAPAPTDKASEWQSLFDGRTLKGWTPKINHRALGENYKKTFVADRGVLRVSYDKYDRFFDEFAHITYKTPFSHYRLRMDYRFVGTDVPGYFEWTKGNSGVMIHGQDPRTMELDQPFPLSVEVQLLNSDATMQRAPGNICTPGTKVQKDGAPYTPHCMPTTARPYSGENWVHLEIEVHGNDSVQVFVDGVKVSEFQKPELDLNELRAAKLWYDNGQKSPMLESGYISLQGEGHPIEFRNIQIKQLTK